MAAIALFRYRMNVVAVIAICGAAGYQLVSCDAIQPAAPQIAITATTFIR